MKSIKLIALNLLLGLTAFSQVPQLNKNGDTTLCFSIEQSKFLAKEHYRAEKYYKLDSICELQLNQKRLEVNMYKKIQNDLESVISNLNSISGLKEEQINILKKTIDEKDKKIKIQKVYKWTAIIVGGTVSGLMGYLYITK